MNWLNLTIWVSFTFCLSLTAGGLMVVFRRDARRGLAGARTLQYFLVFLYVFGFYSLWSEIFLPWLLAADETTSITALVSLLGGPFFGISLAMQLAWANQAQARRHAVPVGLTGGACLAAFAALSATDLSAYQVYRTGAAVAAILTGSACAALFALGRSPQLASRARLVMAGLLLAGAVLHVSYFTSLQHSTFFAPLFAVAFFLANTAVGVAYFYLANTADDSGNLDELSDRYGITSRESDVIRGVYAGLTNQEIADELSVTLQTVKDHTSRIYQKTQVKNRTQLAALLRKAGVNG